MKDSYVSVNYYMVRCRLAFCHARLNAPSFALPWKLNSPSLASISCGDHLDIQCAMSTSQGVTRW